jgi:hypothetical protein
MKITRHPVDVQRVTNVFQSRQEDLAESLECARRNSTTLDLLFRDASRIYLAGSVLAPNSPHVAHALTLAAQAGAALFLFQHIEDPPRPFVLGEGPPVVYVQPAGSSSAAFFNWMTVFYLCLITRQTHLTDEVCRVPNDVFRHSDIVGAATEDYSYGDMLRAVWTHEHFTRTPIFVRVEAECRRNADTNRRKPNYVRLITLPYLQALRYLEERDDKGFAAALTEALQGHKEYWSHSKYRQEFNGFVSVPLTAVAALAWDRGLRFAVDSDYLPLSWVRGDLFPAGGSGPSDGPAPATGGKL